MSKNTITLKESVEFDKDALCAFSKKIQSWVKEGLNEEQINGKIGAMVTAKDLEILKPYVDHHAENPNAQKSLVMKPIKPTIHKKVEDLWKETDPWDGEFLSGLTHDGRTSLMRVAEELQMVALRSKICLFLAYFMHMKLEKDLENPDEMTGEKLIADFKKDLNIDLPHPKIKDDESAEEDASVAI